MPVSIRIALIALVLVSHLATAGSAADESLEAVRASIRKASAELPIDQLQSSPIPGLFQATLAGTSGYVTADGKYFITGDLFDVRTHANLSDEGRKTDRKKLITQLNRRDEITFSPAKPKYTITVFTDVDCAYCRKLHSEMAKLNDLGIAVRYIAYPRSGPNTESWTKMEAVWCSKDRNEAITRAKRDEKVEKPADCKTTPIAEQYALGQKFGVQGTPMIVLEDGGVVGGYLPPEKLVEYLEQHPAEKTAARQ